MVKCIAGTAGEESPLRRRMIEDMQLAGLSKGTQETYIYAVRALQRHTGCCPSRLSEEDVRNYLVYLREEKKVAKGTFETAFFGLKFFFYRTLDLNWSLFTKKKFANQGRSEFHLLSLSKTVVA
ncbi:MAG: site-specific integrase [Planctomycetota bacterium]|jgi:hypothetical protein